MTLPFVADSPVQSVTDTSTVDLALALGVLSAAVEISANAGNQLSVVGDGLFISAAVSVAGCPVQVGLIPGKTYLISGLSQGALGTFSVIAVALSATQLSAAVKVFPAGAPANSNGWPGVINWTTCQLLELHDGVNNLIEGTNNISAFRWFSSNVTDNYISASSIVTFGVGWLGIFRDNRISGLSNFEGDSIPIGGSFSQNLLVDTSVTIIKTIGSITVNGNSFQAGPTINIFTEFFTVEVIHNVFENDHTLDLISGTVTITNSVFNGGTVTVDTADGSILLNHVATLNGLIDVTSDNGVWNVLNSYIGPGGNLVLSNIAAGPGIINNLQLWSGLSIADIATGGSLSLTDVVLHFSPGSILNFNNSIADHTVHRIFAAPGNFIDFSVTSLLALEDIFLAYNSSLVSGGLTTGSIVEDIYIEGGVLTVAGFDAQRLRLQNESSTLIANTADAIKSGYINALP